MGYSEADVRVRGDTGVECFRGDATGEDEFVDNESDRRLNREATL